MTTSSGAYTMPENLAVELYDVRKEYLLGQTKVEALRGVTLAVDKGEFVAIAGPSGSGKSTILNIIGCIDIPTAGEVIVNGRNTRGMTDKALTRYRRITVGFIFQSFNLIPVLNVYENIELPLLLQNMSDPKERRERVMHFIEETGLTDRMGNKPGELSGGQRQRVAIARALVTKPVLVLADEPTANLDSATGAKILDLMNEINSLEGTTFIFSTHDHRIMDHARRLVSIADGTVITDEKKGS